MVSPTNKVHVLDEKERESILKRFRRKTLLEHLMGPFGSILFHILVIVVAVKFMVFDSVQKAPDIEVMVVEPDAVDLEKFEEELEKLEELQDMTDVVAPPDVQMDMDAPVSSEDPGPTAEEPSMDMAALNVLNDSSPLVMKGLFAGRSAAGQASALSQYGGRWAAVIASSVNKALEWLKANQHPDGYWTSKAGGDDSSRMTVGITGLALLAFLAHGETTSSEKYGPVVEKAVRWLAGQQDENGYFVEPQKDGGSYKAGTYGHAIATYALSEAYGLTRIPSLRPVMEKAVDRIIDGQQDGGGWFYKYEKGNDANSSVSAWQVQALKAASLAGASNSRIKESMQKYIEFMKKRQDPASGKFFYIRVGDPGDAHVAKYSGITGAATLSLQLLGEGRSPEVRRALNALEKVIIDWANPPAWAMSEWYYITQAKFHAGGAGWEAWNNRFVKEFVTNQNDDGSWNSPANTEAQNAGKINIEFGFENFFGPAFSTAMSCLTLQVYYRFLPTYKPVATETETEKNENEVSIEII